jgi:hypothetical protein
MRENKKNTKIKVPLSNQRGMALLTTLIFTFVLVSLGVALLTMTNNDSKLSTLQRESNRAFYLAETGIEKTFYNLTVDDDYNMLEWRPGDTHPIFSEGNTEEYFEVTVINIGNTGATPPEEETDKIKIISTGFVEKGKFSSGQRKIEVIATIDFMQETTYKYAVLSERVIILNGSPGATIEGDIHSNDAIEVRGQFDDFYTGGTATAGGVNNEVYDEDELIDGFNINGEIVPIPTINYDGTGEGYTYEDSLLYAAETNLTVHDGPVDLDNGNVEYWTGVHYIKGDLTAKNSAGIMITNGVIVVEGDVDIRNTGVFEHTIVEPYESPFSHLALVATGDILMHAKSSVLNGVVQSIEKDGTSTGTIDFRNGSTVRGSVIAKTVMLHNKTNIIYDEEGLNEETTWGDGFYKKISWQEVY